MSDRYAITGANGNLGVRAITTLGVDRVRALVRSPRAKEALLETFPTLEVFIVDYIDAASLRIALDGCEVLVHLVGIIKETQYSSYNDAHERSCEALKLGLPESIKHIVYLSIVGSAADSGNKCLASKGRAEDILLTSGVTVSILQVPMVLGEGDFASAALKKNSRKRFALTFRAESLEQPIYAADVIAAICAAANVGGGGRFQLAGPESLSRRSLIQRAAHLQGRAVTVLSLPIALGVLLTWILECLPNPPVTRAMLGVLDHDDQTDSQESLEKLKITLTPLNETLSKILDS